jgi:hypothetical protein
MIFFVLGKKILKVKLRAVSTTLSSILFIPFEKCEVKIGQFSRARLTVTAQQSVTKFIAMIVINLVAQKVADKQREVC